MFSLSSSYLEKLDRLAQKLYASTDGCCRSYKTSYIITLKEIAQVVQDAEYWQVPNLNEVVERARRILDGAIRYAYSFEFRDSVEAYRIDYLPSFAHFRNAPLVEDPLWKGFLDSTKPTLFEVLLVIYRTLRLIVTVARTPGAAEARTPASELVDFQALLPSRLKEKPRQLPWTQLHPLCPHSTRLSRFRAADKTSATDATPLAQTIYQARCEVSTDSTIVSPFSAAMSPDCSVLGVLSAGGYKESDPLLNLYYLDDKNSNVRSAGGSTGSGFRRIIIELRLSRAAYSLAMDDTHKLAFVGDEHRVKSYAWGNDVSFGDYRARRRDNVHTLNSKDFEGPLAMLPGGRVARGGKGRAAIWKIDDLETHEGTGVRIGDAFDDEYMYRDLSAVEDSAGSAPHTTIAFDERERMPAVWRWHGPTGKMLCDEGHPRALPGRYGCFLIGPQGRTAATFLGHGGFVQAMSVSAGDAHLFATACSDGYARLFDVRTHLPVVTFDASQVSDECAAVCFVHPDGVPTLFTGGKRHENITLWDVRAKKTVYELATGNNQVRSMAWDGARSTLYAATICAHVDGTSYGSEYRVARVLRWARKDPSKYPDDYDDEPGNVHEEDDPRDAWHRERMEVRNGGCNWPKHARHTEDFFGYAWDAGWHNLARYRFREDADTTMLPDYPPLH
ncbi:hypothetical protein V8D89_007165 [Ganoderma adspersum]